MHLNIEISKDEGKFNINIGGKVSLCTQKRLLHSPTLETTAPQEKGK